MKRILLTLVFATLAAASFAQDIKPTVTINAKGDDVRSVIHDLFKQSNRNFVLNPGVRFVLYLSLDKVSFNDALNIICKNANLKYEIQSDVYYISAVAPKPVEAPKPAVEQKPVVEQKAVEKTPVKPEAAKAKGTLPSTVLAKRITTRFQKKDIREVIGALAQQSGITIEVSEDIPAYKLDAYLINTSLKFALDEITRATKLKYRFTDKLTISVEK